MQKGYRIAVPPGITIKEQIADRKLSRKEFAQRMNIDEKYVNELINGEMYLTKAVADKLELVFGIPASFWINLESIYRKNDSNKK